MNYPARSATTLHGHSPDCGLCGLRVYGLWVAVEAPPAGCSDGHDDAPGVCVHVLASLGLAVVRLDHMNLPLLPHHEVLIKLVGAARWAEIQAHVRAHRGPPRSAPRREPNYDRPVLQ